MDNQPFSGDQLYLPNNKNYDLKSLPTLYFIIRFTMAKEVFSLAPSIWEPAPDSAKQEWSISQPC